MIYGSATNPGTVDLFNSLFTEGFAIYGGIPHGNSGYSVSSAGDFNDDGYDDIIIGAPNYDISYVIYGSSINPGAINLANALGAQGFSVSSSSHGDGSGISVSSAGDVNGDGFGDIIIGAYGASPNSRSRAGTSYVIYGSSSNPGTINLANALGTKGFLVNGGALEDYSGRCVSSAGDVNGDGYDDIIIGAHQADPSSRTDAGISYVIYGSSTNPGTIDLINALGTKGFSVYGGAANDYSGYSVSAAGDVNGDGFSDIIIGAYGADPGSRSGAGISYVIYGTASNPGTIDLANALGTKGFSIYGRNSCSGYSVSSAGDINSDGYSDIIIGAPFEAPNSRTSAGISYVIYGSSINPGTIDLINTLGTKGFTVNGGANDDYSGSSVSSAGDVNGDGYDDIIIGAYRATPSSRTFAGISYVIYDNIATQPPTITPSTIPTTSPTALPTLNPSIAPTTVPSIMPTAAPTVTPSAVPSVNPTVAPTRIPTIVPSVIPTVMPTIVPTQTPTAIPTEQPTSQPSVQPTLQPTIYPSGEPTCQSTGQPTSQPSDQPSVQPFADPTSSPSDQPSRQPSNQPSHQPTTQPSVYPTIQPSGQPTKYPSTQPTSSPTISPTNNINTPYNIIFISSGGNVIRNTAKTNFIINATSDVTIEGNGGSAIFTIIPQSNVLTTITNFNNNDDIISLLDFKNIHNLTDLNITENTLITLDNGEQIKLLNLNETNLSNDNFIFAPIIQEENINYGSNQQLSIDTIVGIAITGILSLFVASFVVRSYHLWPFNNLVNPITDDVLQNIVAGDICKIAPEEGLQ